MEWPPLETYNTCQTKATLMIARVIVVSVLTIVAQLVKPVSKVSKRIELVRKDTIF